MSDDEIRDLVRRHRMTPEEYRRTVQKEALDQAVKAILEGVYGDRLPAKARKEGGS